MHIVKDDGLHRHLRFRKPGTGIYWFDIVTWPGTLCINGDCGTYVFARVEDMFDFFRMDRRDYNHSSQRKLNINPGYWSEKLRAPEHRDAKVFSPSLYREAVHEEVKQHIDSHPMSKEQYADLWEQINDQLFDVASGNDGSEAYIAARDFEYHYMCGLDGGVRVVQFDDFWEHNTQDFSFHFLWNCYAIAYGIQMYDAAEKPVVQPAAIVEVWNEGGSGEFRTAKGIEKLPHGTKLYTGVQNCTPA